MRKWGEWSVKEITAPSVEPVTLADMREHLNITATGSPAEHPDDDLITAQIKAARRYVESYLGKALVETQLRLYLDEFPVYDDFIELPRTNLISIDSVQYVDSDGVTQTWSDSNYSADTSSFVGRVLLGFNKDWPTTRAVRQAVMITYKAGYAPSSDSPPDYRENIPDDIIAGIKLIVGDLYEKREASTPIETYHNDTVEALLHPYREIHL